MRSGEPGAGGDARTGPAATSGRARRNPEGTGPSRRRLAVLGAVGLFLLLSGALVGWFRHAREVENRLVRADRLEAAGSLAEAREVLRAAMDLAPYNGTVRERFERVDRRIRAEREAQEKRPQSPEAAPREPARADGE